jgi:hypothetical protein
MIRVNDSDGMAMNFSIRKFVPILNQLCLRMVLNCLQVPIDVEVRLEKVHKHLSCLF